MRLLILFLALLLTPAHILAQSERQGSPSATPPAAGPLARNLVMFTRPGPNFSNLSRHLAEARAHQMLYERLAAEGHTVAGGAFEGEPVLGMTIFREGVDEAGARALIAEDELPRLGIVAYEFRMLGVRMGALRRE